MGLSKLPRYKSPQPFGEAKFERVVKNKSTLNNPRFIKRCKEAGIPATKRQASKFNRKLGVVYNG